MRRASGRALGIWTPSEVDRITVRREDWAHVVVRARSSEEVSRIKLGFNRREGSAAATTNATNALFPFQCQGDNTFVVLQPDSSPMIP